MDTEIGDQHKVRHLQPRHRTTRLDPYEAEGNKIDRNMQVPRGETPIQRRREAKRSSRDSDRPGSDGDRAVRPYTAVQR